MCEMTLKQILDSDEFEFKHTKEVWQCPCGAEHVIDHEDLFDTFAVVHTCACGKQWCWRTGSELYSLPRLLNPAHENISKT